jgi:hypothetical protein
MLGVWAERHPTAARRWPAATTAVCGGSGDGAQCRANKRRHTPLGVLGSRLRWLVVRDYERAGEFGRRVAMAAGGSVWRADGGKALGFYRRGLPGDIAVTTEMLLYHGYLGRCAYGGIVGDSPRGPLKQRGNPHLKPATKPKRNLPNPARNGPRRKDPDGPSRRPS